jgi:thioredoxin 1
MKTLDETAQRFFGPFNFMSPVQAGQSMCDTLLLSALRSFQARGIRCALGMVMLNKAENMNTQKGSLPVVVMGVNFKAEVLESKQPILVEFWAPWSRPCQVMDSVLQELASAWAGNVKVVKVNADDSLDLSLWYDIQSVPTLLYFVQGNPCLRIIGTASMGAILAKIQPFSQ